MSHDENTMLSILAQRTHEMNTSDLSEEMAMSPARTRHCLRKLEEEDLVSIDYQQDSSVTVMLTAKGDEYVVENDLDHGDDDE